MNCNVLAIHVDTNLVVLHRSTRYSLASVILDIILILIAFECIYN